MRSNKLRGIIAAVGSVLMLGAAVPAMADSTDDILNALIKKGVLTEEEGKLLTKGRAGEKEAAAAKKKGEVKAGFKDGIYWESGDKQHKIAVSGRVQLDYRSFSDENSTKQADTFDIRRAYLGVSGKLFGNYTFDVTESSGDLLYAWLNANYWDGAQIQFGQFKQPFSMEELGSSRYLNFTERSYTTQLAPGFDRGVQLHGTPIKGLTYALGVFNGVDINKGQNTNDALSKAGTAGDGKAVTGRVTANIAEFMGNKDAVFHLGAAYSKSTENAGANPIKFGSEGRGTDVVKVNAFTAPGANNDGYDINRYGLEGAVAYGPFKLQSEYVNAEFAPDGNNPLVAGAVAGKNYDVKAWNVSANWMITGESYANQYGGGKFGKRTTPKNNFTGAGSSGWGAWEIGARFSKLDASDFSSAQISNSYDVTTPAENGRFDEAKSYTVGLKWIPNPNVSYLLNYIKTDMNCVSGQVCTNDEEKAVNLRAQIDF